MKRRIVFLICAMLAAMILTGCAGADGEGGTDVPSSASVPDTTEDEVRMVGVEFYGYPVNTGLPFYADEDAAYYLYGGCQRFAVKLSDGTVVSPADAIERGIAVPRDLKEYGVDYRKAVPGTEEYTLASMQFLHSGDWETVRRAAYFVGFTMSGMKDWREPYYRLEDMVVFFRWVVMPDWNRETYVKEEYDRYLVIDERGSENYMIPCSVMEEELRKYVDRSFEDYDPDGVIAVQRPFPTEIAGGMIRPDVPITINDGWYYVLCYGNDETYSGYYSDDGVYAPVVDYTFSLYVKVAQDGSWMISPGDPPRRYAYSEADVDCLIIGESTMEDLRRIAPYVLPCYAQENGTDRTYVVLPGSSGKDMLAIFDRNDILCEIRLSF